MFTYSHAQGLFGGLSLDGKILSVRAGCNKAFYGKPVDCGDILSGKIEEFPKNRDYDAIVSLLNRHSELDNIYVEVKGQEQEEDGLQPVVEEEKEDGMDKEEEEEKANVLESNIEKQGDDGHTLSGESDDEHAPDEMVTDEGVSDGIGAK